MSFIIVPFYPSVPKHENAHKGPASHTLDVICLHVLCTLVVHAIVQCVRSLVCLVVEWNIHQQEYSLYD